MIEKIYFYLNSLDERQRNILLFGVFFVIIFVGIAFITIPNYNSLNKVKSRFYLEIKRYNELRKLGGEYRIVSNNSYKKKIPLTLSRINTILLNLNLKEYLQSIRPLNKQNKKAFELVFSKLNPDQLALFINEIKKENYRVYFISVENRMVDNKLNVRIVIGD